MRAIVNLTPGLFFKADVSIGVLILSGRGARNGARFVSTDGLFGSRAGAGMLASTRVRRVVALFSAGRSASCLSTGVSGDTVTGGSCGLSMDTCMRTRSAHRTVSVGALGDRLGAAITGVSGLHTSVSGVITRVRT